MTQREMVLQLAEERYGTQPEYLWARTPAYAALRHPNKKRYAAVPDVPKRIQINICRWHMHPKLRWKKSALRNRLLTEEVFAKRLDNPYIFKTNTVFLHKTSPAPCAPAGAMQASNRPEGGS